MRKGRITLNHLEWLRTQGGQIAGPDQSAHPVVPKTSGKSSAVGLISFATGIFLISILGVHARGIQTPNVVVGGLMFLGGICQFISGIFRHVQIDLMETT